MTDEIEKSLTSGTKNFGLKSEVIICQCVVSVSAVGCQLVCLIIRARGKQASIKARVMLAYIHSELLI